MTMDRFSFSLRPRVARWLALAALGTQLVACSVFSSGNTPEPKPLAPIEAQFPVSEVWQRDIGGLGDIQLTPLVRDQSVTLATASGTVVSLHPATGEELWRASLDERLVAGVGGDGRTFAVISAQNEVLALRDGQVQWRYALPGRAFTAPLVAGERVFVVSADRSVYALDAENGALIWDRPGPVDEALALQHSLLLTAVRNTLVVGMSGRMVGINPDSGAIRWEAPIAIPRGVNDIERLVDLVGHFSRAGDSVCAQAFQAAIGCVDADRGLTVWTQRLGGSAGVHGDADAVFSVDATGRLQGWDRRDGRQLWLSDSLQYRKLSGPLLVGRVVMVGDADGLVHLFDRTDAAPLNRLQTNGSGIRLAPVFASNTVIVITNNGKVYGYRPD
ncbi:hypothetical protein AAV94_07335 [Lampropedia cohaerens]|uniref:Outer membrane protein assembly factor BamB n=1 Tax=Lampropedia cohaerens TaxID=1610491 RepID=A0A0U1PZR2_9BURK|nr:outer membrane protein assembly factor BamB [Lampropedia cohaerens]KKW67976.1 hypothetical protein AAV94_07335 [Lampropedia cohaerens]